MPKKIPSMFSYRGCAEGKACLYAIGLKDGFVKIGMTKNVRSRVMLHRRTFGDRFDWVHVFAESRYAMSGEARLKAKLEQVGKRVRKTEVFGGVDKATVLRLGREVLAAARDFYEKAEATTKRQREWDAFYRRMLDDARKQFSELNAADKEA